MELTFVRVEDVQKPCVLCGEVPAELRVQREGENAQAARAVCVECTMCLVQAGCGRETVRDCEPL